MNNKKKIIIGIGISILIIIVAICIIIFVVNKNNKFSEQIVTANFKVKDIICTKGQEIKVEIELLDNSEFVAANLEYKYDIANLEYISYEVGESLKDGAMTMVNNDEANQKIKIGYVSKPDGEKVIKSGKIIDINFKVKDNLTKNNIENILTCTTLKKDDGTDVKYNIKQGKISINK